MKNKNIDHEPLKFGKYKGKTPDEVADVDPNYVSWMFKTISPKPCSKELNDACERDIVDNDAEFTIDYRIDFPH